MVDGTAYLKSHPHQGLGGRLCCEVQFADGLQKIDMGLTSAGGVGLGCLLNQLNGRLHTLIIHDFCDTVQSRRRLKTGNYRPERFLSLTVNGGRLGGSWTALQLLLWKALLGHSSAYNSSALGDC